MKTLVTVSLLLLLWPLSPSAQPDERPSLSYLRGDYRSVSVVAHILIREAEVTRRIGGYENWRVAAEVRESFKGKFRKGEVIEYFHGTEAGATKEYFSGDKIVFLLAEYDADKKTFRYAALENSTLPHWADSIKKLRMIRRSEAKRRSRR